MTIRKDSDLKRMRLTVPAKTVRWILVPLVSAVCVHADEDPGKWKPSSDCKEIRSYAESLEKQYSKYQTELLKTTGIPDSNAKAMSEISQKIGPEIPTNQRNQDLLQYVKTNKSSMDEIGPRLAKLGFSLVRDGYLGLATEVIDATLKGSTLPIYEKLKDEPTLLLQPHLIPGGTAAICTAYHYQPGQMKTVEKKLSSALKKKFDLSLGVSTAKRFSSDNLRKALDEESTTAAQDNTKVVPATRPIRKSGEL